MGISSYTIVLSRGLKHVSHCMYLFFGLWWSKSAKFDVLSPTIEQKVNPKMETHNTENTFSDALVRLR